MKRIRLGEIVYGWIYLITNTIENKSYVGATTRIPSFHWMYHHRKLGKNLTEGGQLLHKAINRFGEESFSLKVLKRVYSKVEFEKWEIHYINEYNCLEPNGYNKRLGGKGGGKYPEESSFRKTMGERSTAYYSDPKVRLKHSEITRAAMQRPEVMTNLINSHNTPEYIAKMSEFNGKGTIWINNGSKNKRLKRGELIPEGWASGFYSNWSRHSKS